MDEKFLRPDEIAKQLDVNIRDSQIWLEVVNW